MRTEPGQSMNINQWEDLCEGTYPGYGDTETEAKAYAALTEVLDESSIPDVMHLLTERSHWPAHDPARLYELDQRISSLARLLLHHGWQPPQHLAYTPIELTPVAMSPLAEEQLDFGEAMLALEREASLSERGGDDHDAR